MRRKNLLVLLVIGLMLCSFLTLQAGVFPARAASGNLADDAVAYLYSAYQSNGSNLGPYNAYILQNAGVDISGWEDNKDVTLTDAVYGSVYQDIQSPGAVAAKNLAYDLLGAKALGRDDLVVQLLAILQGRQSSNGFDNHIYSDMPAYDALGRAGMLSVFNTVYAESYILGTQTSTGVWADFMSTAEAVRALNYLDPGAASNSSVGKVISSGCSWLKSMQQTDGSFAAGSDDPVIDTAEAVATQVALGLAPYTWTKDGKSAADYLNTDALNSDGSFGTSKNVMDATWALDSFIMLGIQVSLTQSVSAVNGTVTVNLSAVPATTSAIGDFVVTQSINGAAATTITPSAISTSGTTVTLTVPQVAATTSSQSVVISVSYQGGTAIAASAFTVPATSSSVNVRVEGPTSNILADTTVSVTGSALDALNAAVGSGNVGTTTSSYGIYINSIEGVSGNPAVTSGIGTGWLYYVIRNGAIDPTSLSSGADGYTVNDGDQVIFYIGAYQTVSPYANLTYYPVVTVSPQAPTAGQSVTISVYAENFVNYTSLEPLSSDEAAAIGSYTVTVGGANYTTSNGQVTIPGSAVTAGTLSYAVTNYNSLGYPNVVRYTGSISVPSVASGGGSPGTSVGVAVVGSSGQKLYGPAYVSVNPSNQWGLTVLGALDAAVGSTHYVTSSTDVGVWVTSIDGETMQQGGTTGWMYTVNDVEGLVGPAAASIANGNHVIWYWSSSMSQQAPTWAPPTVTGLSPTGGTLAGGASVTITGTNLTAATSVMFGSNAATGVNVVSATQITCTSPAGTGTVDVTVTTPVGGTSATSSADEFTYAGSGANGPSGATSTTGSASVDPATGGTVSLGSNASVTIPAGALNGTAGATVAIQQVSSPPAVPAGLSLLGSVYEFTVGGSMGYSFAEPVTLTFTFDPTAVPAGETPAIYYYDESSDQWVSLGGTVSGSTITVTVDHFTKFAVLAGIAASPAASTAVPAPTPVKGAIFTDVPASFWGYGSIENLSGLGDISGYPDGAFRPNNPITRAEFVAILAKALQLAAYNPAAPDFSDVAQGDWFYGSVGDAVYAGIVKGYSSTFKPDDPITREEMAVILVNALNEQDQAKTNMSAKTGFKDDAGISAWAKGFVAVAVKDGLIKGYSDDNSFRPKSAATRAEACAMIMNFLNIHK